MKRLASASVQPLQPHEVFDAERLRRDQPDGEALFARQQELRTAAHEDDVAVFGRGQHHAAKLHDVGFVRDDFAVHPGAQYVVNPIARRLIDEFEHHPIVVETLGDAVEKFLAEHFPTEPPADDFRDRASPRAGFAGDRQIAVRPSRSTAENLSCGRRGPR